MPIAKAASWRERAKAAGINAAVMVASAALFLLLCELLVFRFVFVASDVPRNVWMGDMVRLHPGDQGVMRIGNEISASFEVNAQGWNTGHGDYSCEREACRQRVTIVGDSFVEALQVDHGSSLAEVLSRETGAEVFRFGIGGAPLSHYLLVTEREAMAYSPDWVVIVIVHNDFDESFLFHTGRYGSSFAKLHVVDGEIVGNIDAVPYRPRWVDHVRQSATVRYLFYNLNLRSVYWNFRPIHRLLYGQRDGDPEFEANVDTNVIATRWREIEAVTDYSFAELDTIVRGRGAQLLLVMDGNRHAIYGGEDLTTSTAAALNRLAAETAALHDIPFIDLHPVFAADWLAHGQRFEFSIDNHWNERGHALAAGAIEAALNGHADATQDCSD